jgi:hypothetical protein
METVKVYVEQSSDNDNLTLSALKSFFVFSSTAKDSKFVEDHAQCVFSVGCQTRHVNCANVLNALKSTDEKKGVKILYFGMDYLTHDCMTSICSNIKC